MRRIWKQTALSAGAALLFAGVGVGATFALFTSDAISEIVVGAGSIQSNLTIAVDSLESAMPDGEGTLVDENGRTYSYTAQVGHFANGGTATVDASGNLVLSNITPGDRLHALVNLTNDSNVKTKYRLVLSVPEEDYVLASGLDISINGVSIDSAAYYATDWAVVEANAHMDVNIPLDITLPIDRGNVYQGRSATYSLSMETVQGNASVDAGAVYQPIEMTSQALSPSQVNVSGQVTTLSLPGTETINLSANTPEPIHSGERVSVSLPSGVRLDNGTDHLALVVAKTEGANIAVGSGETINVAYRIDVNGVSEDNNGLITVTVPYDNSVDPTHINHIKDDGTVEVIEPYSELNPNGFLYAGGYITFKTTSFSEFTICSFHKRIYFANVPGWSTVYAYMWKDSGGDNGPFPGVVMTEYLKNSEIHGSTIFSVEQGDFDNVIFSNGSDTGNNKTVDTRIHDGHQYWTTTNDEGSPRSCASISFEDAYNSVYFTRPNENEWTQHTVCAYLWSGDGDTKKQNGDWPGEPAAYMWNNSYEQAIYRASIGNYDNVIFNNQNHNKQTVDITGISGKKGKGFYCSGGADWQGHLYVTEYSVMSYFYVRTLVDAFNDAQDGDTLKLTSNIEIDNPFEVSKSVTLDLNGHNISYKGTAFNIFTVKSGAELTIKDTSDTTQYGKWVDGAYEISPTNSEGATALQGGAIYGGKGEGELLPYEYNARAGGAIIVESDATLNLQGGNIAGNSVPGNTGGISNNGGTVNMSGGAIIDNKASNGSGGAIYNNRGTFNMTGGLIAKNEAYRGAIIVRGATFNFSGGTIRGNTANRYMIDVTPNPEYDPAPLGSVNMSGTAVIENNVCSNVGGAFFLRSGCSLNMSGGTIQNNTTGHWIAKDNPADLVYAGGAICGDEGSGTIAISGGRIAGNIGGGVNVGGTGNRLHLSGNPYIYDNWFDAENGTRLDVFMDDWRGQCPSLVGALTSGAKIGLYEGHYLGDIDTYGCLLRIAYEYSGDGSDILSHLVSTRGANLIYNAAPVKSNVGYWNDGHAYIRQVA